MSADPGPDPLALQGAFADLAQQMLSFTAEAQTMVAALREQGWSAEAADRLACEHGVLLARLFAAGVIEGQARQ